jgi:hypothetical protein
MQDREVVFKVDGKNIQKKKTMRIFLGGDNQFLAMNFGHGGGASSTDFCIFCDCGKAERGTAPKDGKIWGEEGWKTLAELKQETEQVPIFEIPLERVVPIPLHIILGLTKEYLTLFRDELRKLDLESPSEEDAEFRKALEEFHEADEDLMIVSAELKEAKEELSVIRESKSACRIMMEKLALVQFKCCVEMKNGETCQKPGKLEHHLFCGIHKNKGDGIFQKSMAEALKRIGIVSGTVKEALQAINSAEKKLTFLQALKTEESALNTQELASLENVKRLESDGVTKDKGAKAAKEKMGEKSKGTEKQESHLKVNTLDK